MDRSGMDFTEAEDVKRWQEYTDLYKKVFMIQVFMIFMITHHGVITHLETDILIVKSSGP